MLDLSIKTDRLSLRPVNISDAAAITAHVSDARICRNVAAIAAGQSEADTAAFLTAVIAGRAEDTDHVAAIIEGASTLIGLVGAHRRDRGGLLELGYWLAPSYWGHGLMSETTHALKAQLVATGERALVSGYFVDNPASGRVLQKLGFMACGRRPVWCAGRSAFVDHSDMVWIA